MQQGQSIGRIVDWLSYIAAFASALLLAYLTLHFLAEIVLRAFFDTSTYLLVEFASYAMAAMTCLGLGNALNRQEIIRVSLLHALLEDRAPNLRWALELVCCVLALLAVGFVIYAFSKGAMRNFELGVTSYTNIRTPLWIPEAVVIGGLVIFELQLLVYTLRVCLDRSLVESRP